MLIETIEKEEKMTDRFLFMMSRIQNRILGHIKKELKKENISLSPGQMGILLALEKEETTVMGQLSQVLDMDNAALTRLVDGLEKKELVIREINPENRRQILVTITPMGLEQAEVLNPIVRATNDLICHGFSREEMGIYKKINQTILDRFTTG